MDAVPIVMREPIILLNASYELLSENVSLQRAARLLVKNKAVVEEGVEGRFLRHWPWPRVLRLVRYVKVAYHKMYGPATVSRSGVLHRDGHRCGYCLGRANTLDHIRPRSRGGGFTWMNLISACVSCNQRKRDRTPEEAGMPLLLHPFAPRRVRWAS